MLIKEAELRKMEKGNKVIIEYTMGFGKANFIAFLLMIPITFILLMPFALAWSFESFDLGRKALMEYFLPLLIGGIISHELLHGISWGYFAPSGMRSIKFGIKYLTPYCHCKEPLKVKHYRIGGILPLIVLGVLPSLIALIIGHGALLTFGIFFSWAAGGDIIALFMLRKLDSETYISDHPDKMGFYRELDFNETTNTQQR